MHKIIPHPVLYTPEEGGFHLTEDTGICVPPAVDELHRLGETLAGYLRPATGLPLPVKESMEPTTPGCFTLTLKEDASLGPEGYELCVRPEYVSLSAPRAAGLFHGLQTIRQMLPAAIEKRSLQAGPWQMEAATIHDWPRFGWRGAMLDVSRHFFGPEAVKRYIDQLAAYKFNVLHLHLTDDQGWRLMIKSWPRFAEHGGKFSVNRDPGGFYTQEEYRQLVDYAIQRYITIVPEVDMPGHTNAALASYAELNDSGKTPDLYTATGVGFSSFAIRKEITYKMLDEVIGELAALTPGTYIHIGGDEAHSTPDTEYTYFVRRIQEIVKAHGKVCIGWEEIAKAELLPDTVVQFWWNKLWARKGAEQGRKFVMSPATHSYLDMKYDANTALGQDWTKKYIEVQDAYQWDPSTILENVPEASILGIEAPVWSETLVTTDDLDYMIFPRLPGCGEIGWSPLKLRHWSGYRQRLAAHGPRFKAMGIAFYPSPQIEWE